jgi:hypothetical protein
LTIPEEAEKPKGGFVDIETDIVTGACIDGDGRIWLTIDATEHSTDCLSCDYCGAEVSKGMLCIDTKESVCLPCFRSNYAQPS